MMAKGAAPRLKETADQAGDAYVRSLGRQEGEHDEILQGYRGFAGTGGFSPEDIANIRARAIAPTRGIYANANREVDRQRSLQGGYSPNYTAAKAKMAREQSYSLNDANTNVEGMLAQMIQQGKLAGLGGMLNTHGATPGQTNMYGSQRIGAATNLGQTPGDFMQGYNNVMTPIKDVAKLVYPFVAPGADAGGQGGGGNNINSFLR